MKNVLLITIDSFRFDHFLPLAVDGRPDYADSDIAQTAIVPTTTSFSNRSTMFTAAYATGPGTGPSFPAMLTGTLPLSHGGLGPLTYDRPRMAVYLREAGLSTGAFQSNPFLSHFFNYDVGFDQFNDYQNPMIGWATKIFPRGIEVNNPKLSWIDDRLNLVSLVKRSYQAISGKPRPYVSADVITNDAISWLNSLDGSFFLWAHYMDVHHPCFPPREYRAEFDVSDVERETVSDLYSDFARDRDTLSEHQVSLLHRLYDAAIAFTLDQSARLINHLEGSGRVDDTIVIITSDHGELFGEHGRYGKPTRMYDELLHVPLVVINGPNYIGDASNDLVSLLDIPPLIHDVIGIDIPEEYEGRVPGRDEPREYVIAEHEVDGKPIVGARSERWLYEGDEIAGEHRLFDHREDQFTSVDPTTEDDEIDVVRSAVLDRLEQIDVEPRYLRDDLDDDMEARLEDLGYL